MADQPKHHCHWPGCTVEVPPAMWGCSPHWFSLPRRLRDEIWRTYRRGQEVTKSPSAEYIAAAKAVQDWITAFQASQRGLGHRPMDPKRRAEALKIAGAAGVLPDPEVTPYPRESDSLGNRGVKGGSDA